MAYVDSIDGERFLSMTRRTDELLCTDFLGELGEADDGTSWTYHAVRSIVDRFKNFNSYHHAPDSSEPMHKRVLRRLSRPVVYVGGALAAVISLSTAASQTPPEKQINDLPAYVDMTPGDYRTILNDSYVFVYTREDAGNSADITLRNATNISLDLMPGESVLYDVKRTETFEDYDPAFVLVNSGPSGNGTRFWITPTFSSKIVDIYKGFYELKSSNLSDGSYNSSKIDKIKEDSSDARQILQGTRSLLATAANIAANDERNRTLSLNYALSAETVYGSEYLIFSNLGLEQSPFLSNITRVHDMGIGAVRDDVWTRNVADPDYSHIKSELFSDLSLILESNLLLLESRLIDTEIALQRGNNASAQIDALSNILEEDAIGFDSRFDDAMTRFQQKASAIGNASHPAPDDSGPTVVVSPMPDDKKETPWLPVSLAMTAGILAAAAKKYNGQ